jgi:Phage protein Gp138 N-terminal domain
MVFNQQYDLPYDTSNQNKQGSTLPLEEIIRRALIAHTLKLKVCLPCKVANIRGNQEVDVQPLLQGRYSSGDAFDLPQILKVPVSMAQGQNYSIKLPIDVGDTGLCIFSDRSLDVWLAGGGGVVDPQDSRQHDISDAIFIPGLVPFSGQTTDATTDLVITNGKAQLKVQRTGKFVFTNMTNELMDLLDQTEQQLYMLANTLSTDTVNTIFGPMQLNAFSTYASIASAVETIKAKLDTLKGM